MQSEVLLVDLGRHGRRVLQVEDRPQAMAPNDVFSPGQLAEVLCCSPTTIRRLIAQGRLQAGNCDECGGQIVSGSAVMRLYR